MPTVLFLCTGNAARSVMAGAALAARRPDLSIETAGTLAVDGLPISWRTRAAFAAVALEVPQHRSQQATSSHVDRAELIIAAAPEHVEWVRRNHPSAATRTATLVRLVAALGPAAVPLLDRLTALKLADHPLTAEEEIVDPGGGEVEAFIAAARHVVALIEPLAAVL